MKKIVALIFMLMSVGMTFAKSVVFTLTDGTRVYYLLGGEESPVMKFVDGKMTVNSDTYEFSGIKSFCISDEDDPNLTNVANVVKASARFDGNTLFVAQENANVKVYDASGKAVSATISSSAGYTSVDLSSMPKGIYLINIGENSVKVVKK